VSLRSWHVGLALAVLIGAISGRLLSHQYGGRFALPTPLDADVWHVISPGLEAGRVYPGRGSHTGDGALVITDHVFFRSDLLVPQLDGVPAAVDVVLAKDSAKLAVVLGSRVLLDPMPDARTFSLAIDAGSLVLTSAGQQRVISPAQAGKLEISAEDGSARIEQLVIRDEQGGILLNEDFTTVGISLEVLHIGTLLGAAFGVMLALVFLGRSVLGGAAVSVLILAPPLSVCLVPVHSWLIAVERLYLVNAAPVDLARWILGLSLIPAVMVLLARCAAYGWNPRNDQRWCQRLWLVLALVVLGVHAESSWWMIGAAVWVGLPAIHAYRDRVSAGPLLAMDLLALTAVLVLGWGPGLVIGTAWRIAVIAGGAGVLTGRAPQAAVVALLLLLLAILPATEVALRASPLDAQWDPTQLQEERPSERGWRDPWESWKGRCGPESVDRTVRLLFVGGSSAGGAYQYEDDPTASFVYQSHQRLCAQLPDRVALETYNYGRGNRDTFTISRTIETMLDRTNADVVAAYVGVNDLLADHHPMTRKQREAVVADRHAALKGAAGFARRCRMVTGLWLVTRSLPKPGVSAVSDVPLDDAMENFGRIAQAVSARGGKVVLMTEHMRAEQTEWLDPYREVQQRSADQDPSTYFLDVRPAFEGASDNDMLVDQNHLSRDGSARLSFLIAQGLQPLLFAP